MSLSSLTRGQLSQCSATVSHALDHSSHSKSIKNIVTIKQTLHIY